MKNSHIRPTADSLNPFRDSTAGPVFLPIHRNRRLGYSVGEASVILKRFQWAMARTWHIASLKSHCLQSVYELQPGLQPYHSPHASPEPVTAMRARCR